MLRIAICDDEIIFAKKIEAILSVYMEKKQLPYKISIYNSGKEFSELGIEMLQYKVVFLDINMDNVNGLETAKIIRRYSDDIFVVFVTAYINYVLEGYKFNATRYLLKGKKMFSESIYECMDSILYKMNYIVTKKDIRFREGRKNIILNNLLYIESKLHKLEFHIMEDIMCMYTIYDTLNNIEREYNTYNFIRIHQSFLVNMKHISRIERYVVILSNGKKLAVPRARYRYVEEAIISYKGEL